jgi:hypothetical protein
MARAPLRAKAALFVEPDCRKTCLTERESPAPKIPRLPSVYPEPAGIIDGSATGGHTGLKLVFTVIMPKFPGNPHHGCGRASRHPA